MSTIGERLKRARERKNLKQTQVMKKTGINNKTLSGYENDVSEPDVDTVNKLADIYEVSVDWLYGRGEQNKEAYVEEFIKEYNNLQEEDQEYILGLLKRMPKKV